MIFNTLDFHVRALDNGEPVLVNRPFRLKINPVVDSFSLRIPKKIRTALFHKLNVIVSYQPSQNVPFFALEGYASVQIVEPHIATIYQATREEAVKRVKEYLQLGIQIAAQHDNLFAEHLELWEQLLSTTDEEFDFDYRIARSHRSRRWRAEAVIRITPTAYHYDVLVKNSKTSETIQRHRFKTIECVFPFSQWLGFTKLRWENEDIVGLTKEDQEAFRFQTNL
jgi:hypothetical protein